MKASRPGTLPDVDVPNLASGTTKLLKVLMDENSDFDGITAIVSKFAPVTGKLIALANSGWSTPIKPITTLDQACARLGLDVVRSVSIALVIGKSFNPAHCQHFDTTRFWVSSIMTSDLASVMARDLDVDGAAARAVGLLHNIGLLWLADVMPEAINMALEESGEVESLNHAIQQRCGVSYKTAGEYLFERWQLPGVFIAALGELQDELDADELLMRQLVDAAKSLASLVCLGSESPTLAALGIDETVLRDAFQVAQNRLPSTLELARSLLT